jgi:hypothetical protein
MIIVKEKKFLFFELPRTGTTSIRNKFLAEKIGEIHPGIIRHGSITKFKKNHKNYYEDFNIISCVRNPMDRVLSLFLKMQRDHNNYFSKLDAKKKHTILEKRLLGRYHEINNKNLSFDQYFLKYFKLPYVDWMYYDKKYCDKILRFENLQEDFTSLVEEYNLSIDDTLPTNNKLIGKPSYLKYYTPNTIKRAQFVFSEYFDKTGYNFPEDWGKYKTSTSQKILSKITSMLYKFVNNNFK